MITVIELIEQLLAFPRDAHVVMASDSEGNSYAPFSSLSPCNYNVEKRDIGLHKLNEELEAAGFTEADVMYDGEFVICLFPDE